jgi:hypothetical protein
MNACWKTDRFEKQRVLMTFVTGVGRNFRQELPFDRRSSHCGLERSQTTNAHPALGHSVQFVALVALCRAQNVGSGLQDQVHFCIDI